MATNEKRVRTFRFTPSSLVLRVDEKEESICITYHRTTVGKDNSRFTPDWHTPVAAPC